MFSCNVLGHPLKEIRERSLLLLLAKLKLGWELEDELSGTRELLEGLLAWFQTPQQSLQSEALELLLTTIKVRGLSIFKCLINVLLLFYI